MWSGSSKSQSNSSKSNSDSSSNSGNKDSKLEKVNFRDENKNTAIKRVWIAKKSIGVNDDHVQAFNFTYLKFLNKYYKDPKSLELSFEKPMQNVFKIKNEIKFKFKHWAIILELSNNSYVNIQFGKEGISVEEFNQTNIDGESVLNAVIYTWGRESHPLSFCYLGEANYNYEELKKFIESKKQIELFYYIVNGRTYYNGVFYNCQHFSCDIERFIFGYIKGWHSFDYYINEFFEHFFPKININKLKIKYEDDLEGKNKELYTLDYEKIEKNYQTVKNKENIDETIFRKIYLFPLKELKESFFFNRDEDKIDINLDE